MMPACRLLSRIALITLLALFFDEAALAQSVIGVLGITEEIKPVEQRLQDSHEISVRGYVFHRGTLEGRPVVVGRSGAGKVNAAIAATLLIDHFNPSTLFFSGTAGAVDPSLRPGDVVIGSAVAHHDTGQQASTGLSRRGLRNATTGEVDPLLVPAPAALLASATRAIERLALPRIETSEGPRVPRILEGVIVTGDVFMADATRRDELRTSLGASAVEMEGAAVVQTCRQFGVSCLVVRSITDRADGQASTNYLAFRARASENAAIVVAAIVSRLPGQLSKN